MRQSMESKPENDGPDISSRSHDLANFCGALCSSNDLKRIMDTELITLDFQHNLLASSQKFLKSFPNAISDQIKFCKT